MKNHKACTKAFSVVEVLLVIAIVTTVAGLALRVFYATEIIAWENDLVRSIGINPAAYRMILGLGILAIFASTWLRQRRKARRTRERRYQLPK